MPHSFDQVTEADVASVTRQLGRSPRGLLRIVRRSRFGFPQVVLTAPLLIRGSAPEEHVEVFPTQFWLTCPLLYEAIAGLESEGWIERLEARLARDAEFREAMNRSHRAAAAFRLELVPPEWRRRLREDSRYRGQYEVLMGSGVAGIRPGPGGEARGIKCLHAHYADWVGRGDNPVGEWVAARLREAGVREDCDRRCPVRCSPPGENFPKGKTPGRTDRLGGDGFPVRVAAVDVGSHSVRFLVAETTASPRGPAEGVRIRSASPAEGVGPGDGGRAWREVQRGHVGVRLAENWRAGRPLDPAAVERTLATLHEFARLFRSLGVSRVDGIATGVVREATDGREFVARVRRETGLPLRIVSGKEEAILSFRGALAGKGSMPVPATLTLLDIGGATTEWVTGRIYARDPGHGPQGGVPLPGRTAEGKGLTGRVGPWRYEVLGAGSVPAGAERLTEAFLASDPPTEEEWAALTAYVREVLSSHQVGGKERGGGGEVVAVGGTATSLAAMEQGLVRYERSKVHGYRFSYESLAQWVDRLRRMNRREREAIPGLPRERAAVIPAGAAILFIALQRLGALAVEVSEADLLEGLIDGEEALVP